MMANDGRYATDDRPEAQEPRPAVQEASSWGEGSTPFTSHRKATMAAMRLNVWLTRPWRCKVGRHEIADDRNWGFGFGMVDYFCIRCEQRVKSVPVGEVSEYM